MKHRRSRRFAHLQSDVADKAVAEDHLDRVFEKIVPLDIATEVQLASLQQLEDVLGKLASFDILTSDRHQPDSRIRKAEHVF